MTWNPYATYGPGDGRSWREYFNDYRAARDVDDEDNDVDSNPIVLSQATGADLSALPPTLGKLYQKALQTAEIASCGRSWAYVSGAPFKSGEREGEFRPDKVVVQWWMYAVYGNRLLRVTYARDDTWFEQGTVKCVNRQISWDALSDRELKELIA